jgi:hypothetical protein
MAPAQLLPREFELDEARFVERYLRRLQPVIVTGEVPRWPAYRCWSWSYLAERLGHHQVQLFDDWFVPSGSASFADFVATNVGVGEPTVRQRYVRWFARNSEDGDGWADEVFAALCQDWSHPRFLPTSDYVVPPVAPPDRAVANEDGFPYRALFVSAAGARTRLHLDPWTTSAVLCQVIGAKHVQLWPPAQHQALLRLGTDPDHTALAGIAPAYDDMLSAGEILFIPAGWWHQVDTLTDSVSVTWNFVHACVAEFLRAHIGRHPDDPELKVAAYFLAGQPAGEHGGIDALVAAAIDAQARASESATLRRSL